MVCDRILLIFWFYKKRDRENIHILQKINNVDTAFRNLIRSNEIALGIGIITQLQYISSFPNNIFYI